MNGLILRVEFLVNRLSPLIRLAPLVVLVAAVAFPALVMASGGDELSCFGCGCNIITHSLPGPWGCFYGFPPGTDCYTHMDIPCIWWMDQE